MQPVACTTAGFLAAPGSSAILDNRKQGCYEWRVTYAAAGFSALSVQLEQAPDDNGSPGSWAAFTGDSVVTDGTNPVTDTEAATIGIHSAAAFVRLTLVSKTGTGRINYQVFGANGVAASGFSQATGNTTGLRVATVTLSGADLAAINSTPVTAIVAQGAGKKIGQVAYTYESQFTAGTSPYSKYGNLHLAVRYAVSLKTFIPASGAEVTDNAGTDFDTNAIFSAGSSQGTKADFSNRALVFVADSDSTGRVTSSNVTIEGGGLLYAPGDTFDIDGTNASGVVDTVDIGGIVLTYHLTAQGTDISLAGIKPTTATSGTGSGLFIDITAIQSVSAGDGTLTLTIPYIVVTLQ